MTAKLAFENLLSQVQSSNLNFRIDLSPFSATIFLKKSFVKNQHGIHVHHPPNPAMEVHRDDQKVKITELELENNSLQEKLESAAREKLSYNERIDDLQKEIKQKQEIIDGLYVANKDLRDESKLMERELYNTRFELTKHSEEAKKDIEKNEEEKTKNQRLKNLVEELKGKLEAAQINNKHIEDKEFKTEQIKMQVQELDEKNKSLSKDITELNDKINNLEVEN